ncbi:caspase family protein [Pseudooceanicola sp. C21-150M6]|uniref:caspase family protein n=1 Tax=Pseudooceanicola sp. C21-150M6 TaxID=3434355 RepID=UPI003D7F616E
MRFLIPLFMIVAATTAQAADRVALVFGVAEYSSIPALDNTVNDARLISDSLRRIGFEVETAIDPTGEQMRDAIDAFAFRAETADLAMVYFAGHGVEVEGQNFLIPSDAEVSSNRDVQRQAVSLDDLLAAVDKARKMRIVILDSCRDNPFGDALDKVETAVAEAQTGGPQTRGGGGLAPADPDRGTLVAFAARDGQVALDGSGANSPFAIALSDRISKPGLEISLMFRQVRDQVLEQTANLQEPYTYGSLSGIPFYLNGDNALAEDTEDGRRAAWSQLRPEQELQLAALADTGDTRSMLGLAYIRLNPEADRFDPDSAVQYLQRAAEAGSPEAQFELAKLYEKGLGVGQDQARALELFQQAADQEFADALNDLGFLYYQGGLGLQRDEATAMTYFERAANQRHPEAMFNFAALIDDGVVSGKGPEDAARYLYDALRSGSQDVMELLANRPTMFKATTRRALQEKLRSFNFYTGAIDGDFGPGTQRGLRRAFGAAG